MFKFVLLIMIVVAIYLLWQHVQKLKAQANKQSEAKPMQQCHYCHVYVSQDEAIRGSHNQWYCCSEHAKQVEK